MSKLSPQSSTLKLALVKLNDWQLTSKDGKYTIKINDELIELDSVDAVIEYLNKQI